MSEGTPELTTVSAVSGAEPGVAGESKKRKRTGKDRKEAKALAEQAQARMAEIIAAAAKEAPPPAPPANVVVDTVGSAASDVKAELDAQAAVALAAAKAAAAAAKREPESIAGRIPQGLKAIHPLLKQAKTFETQRLIKKIRWSRSKEEDVSDMEAQNAALSDIHLHDLALSHLRTKISKHHLFKHNPLPSPISTALSPSSASAAASTSADAAQKAKGENRLISSKIVADGMKDILGWVVGDPGARLVSRPMAAKAEREKKKGKGMDEGRKRMLMEVKDEDDDLDMGDDGEADEGDDVVIGDEDEESDDGMNEEGDAEAFAADAAGWESGSVDDIGDSGDEEEGSDRESDDSGAVIPAKRAKSGPTLKSAKLPTNTKPTPQSKPTKVAAPTKTEKVKPKAEKKQKREDITSSLFLPSLASGFTRGDSDDSDPDLDFDADGTIGKQGAERKNRRGQRARQAIWEKKYGKNAKHVVKSLEADNVAQAENNIKNAYGKRAAVGVGAEASVGGKPAAGRPAGRPTSATGAGRPSAGTSTYVSKPAYTPAAPAAAPAPAAAGSSGLHPSWEAARRKKQLLAEAPAAQKIVFD